jgi:hypothetical protein
VQKKKKGLPHAFVGATILNVSCKDFRQIQIVFTKDILSIWKALPVQFKKLFEFRAVNSGHYNYLASFLYNQLAKDSPGFKYDIEDDFKKQGISDIRFFQKSTLNEKYELCPSYPKVLYFPSVPSPDILHASAKFRSSRRLPAITYFSQRFDGFIVRCAQPLTGVASATSEGDEMLFKTFRFASISDYKENKDKPLYLIDARSQVAAVGNRLKGKGFENLTRYDCLKLEFMDIANIHSMRNSLDKFWSLIVQPLRVIASHSETWFHGLDASKWSYHVLNLLQAAGRVTYLLFSQKISVVVHCSDGWDRTSQICALACIMLDGRYRTKEGFMAVVERDFLAFGHKFEDRLGSQSCPDERSPVFLQFLDCVFQLLIQFPSYFEFSEHYLIAIVDCIHSGWFGTFCCNNEKERVELDVHNQSFSIWEHVNNPNIKKYSNPSYDPATSNRVLRVLCSYKQYQIWRTLFLRYADYQTNASYEFEDESAYESSVFGDV